ncbi:hypothetical protein Thexy_1793 [Thermoanaerobacterium xylanolyticum LX-11]|uniref:DUF4062 domain-containing protein n=1 Tax=Thermoanaerobacterium xylanolyticum (strain ATCC 49914 / DSM 7097 / LX-11) TaxID=858215 RepID=F6BIT2_THEXL|nr:hypothetical protein [Thermoanaerobacterium xylanolyticum]AEF17817.1 hypothetical protein Thexy_1793 [Thermoanaerobacterium xylanolyticum LX-11]
MIRRMEVDEKIKVFISSQCGIEKYDHVRKELKRLIEGTGFAKVYLFEERLASTQTAEQDYLYALDDSDVCIFLIDNADGVTPAVLREIKRAKSHPKKSLYLFCKEKQEEPTQIQKELIGAHGAKYYIVNTFEEFINKGYESLINDISNVYSNYCKNRYIDPEFTLNQGTNMEIGAIASEALEKRLFEGIKKTKLYLSRQILNEVQKEVSETSELDLYCEDFLHVLFGEKNIRECNIFLLLSTLENLQSKKLHEVVVNRWKAIQYFWNDDIDRCITYEEAALEIAKKNSLSNWIVQDILIDLRNLYMLQGQQNNQIVFNSEAQKELDNESTVLFYPLIDRYDKSLYEEITKQNIKSLTRSPYTVSWGNNIDKYIDYLSNVYVTSVFNGSLTHILIIIDRLKDIAFNLCKEYSDWQFRVLLLKLSIRQGNKKETKEFIEFFNDVIGKMNSSDSIEIYNFCNSVPIKYQRDIAKLEAFKYLGYYFSDKDYENISKEIISLIEDWITSEKRNIAVGDYIFEALKENCYRIDRNIIIRICLDIFDKKLYRFYDKALDLIANVGLENIDNDLAKKTINEINKIVTDETIRSKCNNLESAIISIRRSKRDYTDKLHESVSKFMPNFYEETYKLETMIDSLENSEEYIFKYVYKIKERNQTQGKDGKYSLYAYSLFTIIKNIIDMNKIDNNDKLLSTILEVSLETLLCPKQLLLEKVEAIKLIIYMKLNSTSEMYDFEKFFCQIESKKDVVVDGFCDHFYKQTNITIQFCYMLMKMVFDNLDNGELLEYLGMYNELEESEKIEALKALISVFENNYCSKINDNILFMFLQFVLGLSHDSNHDVRYYAVKTLLLMISPATKDPIFTRLSKMMDYDSAYIKNLIINQAENLINIYPDILNFIIQKASVDNHYVIRKRGCELIAKNRL